MPGPTITQETFDRYYDQFQEKVHGSSNRIAVLDHVLTEGKGVYRPEEIASSLEGNRGNKEISNNLTWHLLDQLAILGRTSSTVWTTSEGLRIEIPEIVTWIAACNSRPREIPTSEHYHDGVRFEQALENRVARARWMVLIAADYVAEYDTNAELEDAPVGMAFHALFIAYLAEFCETLKDPQVETFDISSEESTAITGNVRNLDIKVEITAETLVVDDADSLIFELRQKLIYLAALLTYDPEPTALDAEQAETVKDGGHRQAPVNAPEFDDRYTTWQDAIHWLEAETSDRDPLFDELPEITIHEEEGRIVLEYHPRNIRRQ